MHCKYCGNAYVTDSAQCEGCGSPKTMHGDGSQQFFVQVGKAVLMRDSGDPIDALLNLRRGPEAPPKDETQIWVERSAKATLILAALWMFPGLLFAAFILMFWFKTFVVLPYESLKNVFGWIAGDVERR